MRQELDVARMHPFWRRNIEQGEYAVVSGEGRIRSNKEGSRWFPVVGILGKIHFGVVGCVYEDDNREQHVAMMMRSGQWIYGANPPVPRRRLTKEPVLEAARESVGEWDHGEPHKISSAIQECQQAGSPECQTNCNCFGEEDDGQ